MSFCACWAVIYQPYTPLVRLNMSASNPILHYIFNLKKLTLNFTCDLFFFFCPFLPCGSPFNIWSWWAFQKLLSIKNNDRVPLSGYPQRPLLVKIGICLETKHYLLRFRKLLLVVRKSLLSFLPVFWFARWTSCIPLVLSFFCLWSGIIMFLKSAGEVLRLDTVVRNNEECCRDHDRWMKTCFVL